MLQPRGRAIKVGVAVGGAASIGFAVYKSGVLTPAKASKSTSQNAINKKPIAGVMDDRLYEYLLAHTREPEVLRELRQETATMRGSGMQISPEQGQFMAQLVKLLNVKKYLEVGVFTGYSSLAVALALPPDGKVIGLDSDEKSMATARKYWEKAGVQDRVDAKVGKAEDTLAEVMQQHGPQSLDMAFIDADKRGYKDYYEQLLKLVKPGGLIAIDNVLWYGRVADPQVDDKATIALRELNDFLMTDERIDFNIIPVGDGIGMCRVRP